MNESRKIALKISLLYTITSFIFLIFVFYGWYQKEKQSLIEERILQLRESAHNLAIYLQEKLQTSPDNLFELLQKSAKELDITFSLNKENGEVIFNALKESIQIKDFQNILKRKGIPISFKKNHKHIDKIVIIEDNVYLVTQRVGGRFWRLVNLELRKKNLLNFPHQRDDFFMIIQDNGILNEIHTLWLFIGGSFLLALFGMSVIAYFLVRLSLKPLEEKIEILNRFIKDSTHEINTPLSIILMSIERIKKENLKEQDLQKLQRIKMAANTLEQIYQDLVFYNFSHIQENTLEEISMENLLKERISYFEPFYKKKNITITLKSNPSQLKANKNRIIRVIDNLLDNALKYTYNGGKVEVIVDKNTLTIKDNGCGIPKTHLKRIFERYYRYNKDQGGFGIGLALVKKICDSYGIEIQCQSLEKKGTTFILKW
ncbi:sensor histidine kinase [Helicobacter canadensis]|uniref:histidine kinase n=2 Tax=Helicobacter canadensis TaxID=123841 RepID=C5ZV36_9HELI|nr:HAMP domain-containing sensor histidine kinase [Helicobacter canadensis]EES89100.1 sensor histidine kinase [Helicobacter canadensis MIT 98-5491]STO99131.1 two-component sensor histidine kinase [Helicobacter canadensis]